MRIIVDPWVPGGVNRQARKIRRLVYLAWIARDLGHDVAVAGDLTPLRRLRREPAYNGRSGFSYLDLLDEFPAAKEPDGDLLFCSEDQVLGSRRWPCKVVAFRAQLGGGQRLIAHARNFDLLVGYALTQADFTTQRTATGQDRADTPIANPLGGKWLSVPWLPFECVLHRMHEDGMWRAYLTDDLEAIRARYAPRGRIAKLGACAYPWPWRTAIARRLGGDRRFEFQWPTCDSERMPADEYLRWLAGLYASLVLPGDTWKTSRHMESVMMGVPAVHLRGVVDYSPPLTRENTALVSDWTVDEMFDALDFCEVREADAAYRRGWSLRGQFAEILRRLEDEP